MNDWVEMSSELAFLSFTKNGVVGRLALRWARTGCLVVVWERMGRLAVRWARTGRLAVGWVRMGRLAVVWARTDSLAVG